MILAFVTVIGLFARDGGLQDSVAFVFEPAAQILASVDHKRGYDVQKSIDDIKSIQKKYDVANAWNKVSYRRGMMRSDWIDCNSDDATIQTIKDLANEVGATQWSYLNGEGNNYRNTAEVTASKTGIYTGDVGLYWTVEELNDTTSGLTLHNKTEKENYSEELVLQYYYGYSDTKNSYRYFVILSHVWMKQGDVSNGVALGGLHQHWEKPSGYYVGDTNGYTTLLEAQDIFEAARIANNYSVIFGQTAQEAINVFTEAGVEDECVVTSADGEEETTHAE